MLKLIVTLLGSLFFTPVLPYTNLSLLTYAAIILSNTLDFDLMMYTFAVNHASLTTVFYVTNWLCDNSAHSRMALRDGYSYMMYFYLFDFAAHVLPSLFFIYLFNSNNINKNHWYRVSTVTCLYQFCWCMIHNNFTFDLSNMYVPLSCWRFIWTMTILSHYFYGYFLLI